MKNTCSIIVLFLIACACSCSGGQEGFPTLIKVGGPAGLKRVKGTRYFASIPATYRPMEKLVRYQKDNDTYFQVIETPNVNFPYQKSKASKESMERQGAQLNVYQDIAYNNFEGIYAEGLSANRETTQMVLVFGDSTFTTQVLAVCRVSDLASRDELRKILRSSYYDTSYHVNPLELVMFTLDETITGFEVSQRTGNLTHYSAPGHTGNGLSDCPYYQVAPFESGGFEKSKQMIDVITGKIEKQSFTMSNARKDERTISGYKAYEVIYDAEDEHGNKGILYFVVLYKEETQSAVLFNGMDCADGAYMDRFKATAVSIRF